METDVQPGPRLRIVALVAVTACGVLVGPLACGPSLGVVADTSDTSDTDGGGSSQESTGARSSASDAPEPGTDDTSTTGWADSGPGPGSSGSSDPETSSSGAGDGDTGGEDPVDCDQACAVVLKGSCLDGQRSCQALCQDTLPGENTGVHEAFAECVATNYLCFETVEGCILRALHPGATEVDVAYVGTDFEAFEGMDVWVRLHAQDDGPVVSATVIDGTVSVSLTHALELWMGHWLSVFIDVDGNGVCDVDSDLSHVVFLDFDGGFSDPSFSVTSEPPKSANESVCDSF